MPIKDIIVKELAVSYSGVFDIHDFLDFLKKHMKRNGYDIEEKLYDAKTKASIHSIKIKWGCEKKATDYDKYNIAITIDFFDIKEGKIEGKKVVEGNLKVTIEAEHEKDYDEKWRKKPTMNFMRAVYDKFIIESKEEKLAKKLKEEANDIADDVKRYLNIN